MVFHGALRFLRRNINGVLIAFFVDQMNLQLARDRNMNRENIDIWMTDREDEKTEFIRYVQVSPFILSLHALPSVKTMNGK